MLKATGHWFKSNSLHKLNNNQRWVECNYLLYTLWVGSQY
nr:MAG TPA: hypothetical protein [Crassvirales sp.]